MKAWTFISDHQKTKPKPKWSVGWYDDEGKRRKKVIGSKSMAEKAARRIEGELAAGTYKPKCSVAWGTFVDDYTSKILSTLAINTQEATRQALSHFQRIIKPKRVRSIKTQTIDHYVAKRSQEKAKRKSTLVSPATVNKELRHLKAVLHVAEDWGYLDMPKIRMVKEPQKLKRYVTVEHFATIYGLCDAARYPKHLPFTAGDWWRAYLTFCYLTGWRMSEVLALKRADVDLDRMSVITRHGDNKGKRDEVVPISPAVVDQLNAVQCFETKVFPWIHRREQMYTEFNRIQVAAGIHLDCHEADENHECTARCHTYGFHDLRRAFATLNVSRMSGQRLQGLMRHKSFTTTQRYIDMAEQLNSTAEDVYVPEILAIGRA